MIISMNGCGYIQPNLAINYWDSIGQGHSISLIKCSDFIARVANGCTYGICLDSVVNGYHRYLQKFWILGFIKHGITGEAKDDGSHGKEGGEIVYRR